MATLNQGMQITDWLKSEAASYYSREEVTLVSGAGDLVSGTVLGRIASGAATGAAVAGNTGNGTITASPTVGAGAKVGVYKATCIEPASNAGEFVVEDPDGINVGVATVAVEFTGGGLTFTIADGSTDFAAGDAFEITVAAGSGKWTVSPLTGSNGAQAALGILLFPVDATSADKTAVIIRRDAIVSRQGLTYHSSVDDATKRAAKNAQLEAVGILVRDGA